MSMVLMRIAEPNPDTLTRVKIGCLKVAGTWTVTAKLFGPAETGAILQTENEELVCKVSKGIEDEWWTCGSIRGLLSKRIGDIYGRYAAGYYLTIEWFKRPLE